ncbi:hypothetical protein V2P20_14980 [Methylobacter sp. Wu1]|uniref:hypothetical protein n=1 Tax=Methylobacter sp. Wu1 TaxID=3119359 RepID=UPI002F93B024
MKKSFSLYTMACLLFISAGVDSAPSMKIYGIGGGNGRQVDILKPNNGETQPEITVKGSNGAACINIAGRWNFSENGTFTCQAEGEQPFTDPISDTGTFDILQNGCNISYTGPGPDPIKRTGQINGNMVTLSGVLVVPGSGVALSENSFTATGAVNAPDEFTLSGTGQIRGTDSGVPFSCTLNSIGKFTRDSVLRNRIECLLNWAENNYPDLFSPAGATSQFQPPYTYRHYSQTNSYAGVSADNNHVYYLGPDGVLVDVGDLAGWLTRASCQ